GTLIYEPASSVKRGSMLVMVDRKGGIRPITENRAIFAEFAISPKGEQVVARVTAVNDDLWIYDIAPGTPLRLTFEPPDEAGAQWTADGKRIAYGSKIGKIFGNLQTEAELERSFCMANTFADSYLSQRMARLWRSSNVTLPTRETF